MSTLTKPRAKKPTRAVRKARVAVRLPSFMQTDPLTGLAVAKARPGVRILTPAEVRALADA